MHEVDALLSLSKEIVQHAIQRLNQLHSHGKDNEEYAFQADLPREMKAKADIVLERYILDQLKHVRLPVISEEIGFIKGDASSGLRFIVDPLDGTVNYIRDIGPSSISIALYEYDKPIFGVLGIYPDGDLVWGGKNIGSFHNGNPINVSQITDKLKGIICTGIPSRMDLSDPDRGSEFIGMIQEFGKIRMLGAASYSLFQVAKGNAEVYMEQDIMLWDVAAGLALVEGAGGNVLVSSGNTANSICVYATNGKII